MNILCFVNFQIPIEYLSKWLALLLQNHEVLYSSLLSEIGFVYVFVICSSLSEQMLELFVNVSHDLFFLYTFHIYN
jgi:hypothetical protein